MASTFPSLSRKYSTFRNDLPFFVWQRYFANASLPLATTRSRSNCPIKLICVSQQLVLKALLLMWSSPAALEKVKLSASRTSNGPQSFFSTSQVLYHFRTISSAVVLCPAPARALAVTENAAAPTIAQAPASSAFRRDTPILAMSILLFSFLVCCPSIRTGWYAECRTILTQRCNQPLLRLPGARRDFSQSTMFLIPAFITFRS